MQELNLKMIFSLFVQKLRYLLIGAVIGAILLGVYARFGTPDQYMSQFQMYISNYSDFTAIQQASTGGISASQYLVQEYIVILRDDLMIGKIITALQTRGYSMKPSAVRRAIDLTSVDDTAMLKVVVTTDDPELSKALCDSIAEVAPDELHEISGLGSVSLMAPAKPGAKVSRMIPLKAAVGAAIGIVIAGFIVLLKHVLSDTVSDEVELKRRCNVAVLGEVPSFNKKKGGKKNGRA